MKKMELPEPEAVKPELTDMTAASCDGVYDEFHGREGDICTSHYC